VAFVWVEGDFGGFGAVGGSPGVTLSGNKQHDVLGTSDLE